MEKIFITGTGRCGTTFLIKLFTFLEFDTGYTKDTYSEFIYTNCNSGMERKYTDKPYIIKNPLILQDIEQIVNDPSVKIQTIILPIRDFVTSARSRVHIANVAQLKHAPGGLWGAVDEASQIEFYKDIFIQYMYTMTKYDIPTIFLDFDRMVQDKTYLFEKLQSILVEKQVDFALFCRVYDEVSGTSKQADHVCES
jgi:hypothetical protein